jgi:hypothetical protein
MSRGRPITPKDPQEVINRYLSGQTAKEIGFDFGYTDSAAVLKFLRDAGVQIRNRKENQELKEFRNE